MWIQITFHRVAKDCGGDVESIVLCATSERGEMLQVQNGMKNNVFWTYRNKCKAAISQHSIMR
ncbi:uncharacterized protein DS421_8g242690 [Arachis hypogaea]|nr:uncharacterized protein DS421_8g242690 [Arachis hypogaea]